MATATAQNKYYVPHGSHWPIVATVGVATTMVGAATWLNGADYGRNVLIAGVVITVFMMFGWFGTVIRESESGLYNDQVDGSFRWGMMWFIFSEVMFFAAFFGALFYARQYSLPWLGGEGHGIPTNFFLWPGFESMWPQTANGPAHIGGEYETMSPWGVPAINTLILLSSGVTVTLAHWGLKKGKRAQLILGLFATVVLGVIFIVLQAYEYGHAYHELNLTLESGVYGSTFYMLTGFHGMHVTIGAIMLSVILFRSMWGHFTADNHFAFEGVSWYWHFVDVVWLGLFIFVYWI